MDVIPRSYKEIILDHAKEIDGWMTDNDLETLYDLADSNLSQGDLAIEVGSWKGKSTFVLGSVCERKGATLVAIDTFAGDSNSDSFRNQEGPRGYYREAVINPDFYKIFLKNTAGLPIITLVGDSAKMSEFVPDNHFKFCFIDGNHDSPAVDNDIAIYMRKLEPWGILCGHDRGNSTTDVDAAIYRAFKNDFEIHPNCSIWSHRKG